MFNFVFCNFLCSLFMHSCFTGDCVPEERSKFNLASSCFRYKMINLLIYYLSTLVKEELATLDQICAVYVPEGVDPTAFSSIIR